MNANLYSGVSSCRGPATTSDAWTCPKHRPTLLHTMAQHTKKIMKWKNTHTHRKQKKRQPQVETSLMLVLCFKNSIRNSRHFGDFDLCTIRIFRLILFRFKSVEFLANYYACQAFIWNEIKTLKDEFKNYIIQLNYMPHCWQERLIIKRVIMLERGSSLTVTRKAGGFRALGKRLRRLSPCGIYRVEWYSKQQQQTNNKKKEW